MNDASRSVTRGYIYLSDLLAKPDVLHDLGKMIASAYDDKIDAVMTVCNKGVPIRTNRCELLKRTIRHRAP